MHSLLYGLDWTVRPEYLYPPGINIELGSAYVHLLKHRYHSRIEDRPKRLYLSICAYHWGPTAVRRNILNRYTLKDMAAEEVYALLKRKAPAGTAGYLEDVTRRMEQYARLL